MSGPITEMVGAPTEEPAKGYRRVPITLVIHYHEDVPKDWDDHDAEFWIEENHCMSNYIASMQAQEESEPNMCHTCGRAEVYVGHIPFSSVREISK